MTRILEKSRSPKWVYDDSGEVIEVILGYDDFKTLIQKVAQETRLGDTSSPSTGCC